MKITAIEEVDFRSIKVGIVLEDRHEIDVLMRYSPGISEPKLEEILIYLRNQICNAVRR